jgi:hypothetical protein
VVDRVERPAHHPDLPMHPAKTNRFARRNTVATTTP